MATVIPFRGIAYHPEKVPNLSDVATPPYDVISEQEREQYWARHPYNMVRLILGKPTPADTPQNNPHTRAANWFKQWLSEGILIQDTLPTLYLTTVEFPSNRVPLCRFGLIALVKLEPFEKGIILPHERTYSRIRSERLELMKVCHANFSPIFSLYADKHRISVSLKALTAGRRSDAEFTDDKGHRHKLWRITDPVVHAQVSQALRDEKLFIADGHHRYETALNYRNWLASQTPEFSPSHPANYVLMYLSSMDDPGLVILPAHRILTQLSPKSAEDFRLKAPLYFEIKELLFQPHTYHKVRTEFLSKLKSDTTTNTIGVCIHNQMSFYLLTPKPGVMDQMFHQDIPECLRTLDVTVLTRLLLMEVLGLDQAALDDETLISYSRSGEDAVEEVYSKRCAMAFILNPTKIEQVKEVAEQGLIMPRKSTYFYPKVITGQVLNTLVPSSAT